MIDFENNMVMGCIPIADLPQAPQDQQKCEAHPCPMCNAPMWVSEFKRAWIKEAPNRIMRCFRCIIDSHVANGGNVDDIDLLDATKLI